jgi:hypothetical protein
MYFHQRLQASREVARWSPAMGRKKTRRRVSPRCWNAAPRALRFLPHRFDTAAGTPEELLPRMMQPWRFLRGRYGCALPGAYPAGGLNQLGALFTELDIKGPLALVCDDHLAPFIRQTRTGQPDGCRI